MDPSGTRSLEFFRSRRHLAHHLHRAAQSDLRTDIIVREDALHALESGSAQFFRHRMGTLRRLGDTEDNHEAQMVHDLNAYYASKYFQVLTDDDLAAAARLRGELFPEVTPEAYQQRLDWARSLADEKALETTLPEAPPAPKRARL
jgi:hypothetical protein